MAGRKPIVSARQLKARVQIIIRATDKDVAQNTEKNRLIDMAESMREAGVLQEFLLDCLRSKLRQDEGQTVAAYRMFEGGHHAFPQRHSDSPIHFHQQQAHIAPSPAYRAPEAFAEDEPLVNTPEQHVKDAKPAPAEPDAPSSVPAPELVARNGGNESNPTAIIENVMREIESAATYNETGFTEPVPAERRKPKGNMLGAMG